MSTRELGTPLQARQAFRLLINPPDFQTELCEGCEWCEVQKCPEIHSFFYPVCTFIVTEAIPSYNTMCQGAWGVVYLIITKCAPMTRAKKRCDINISPVDLKAALCRVQGVALHAVSFGVLYTSSMLLSNVSEVCLPVPKRPHNPHKKMMRHQNLIPWLQHRILLN